MRRIKIIPLLLAIMMIISNITVAFSDIDYSVVNSGDDNTELSSIVPFDGVAPEAQVIAMKVFSDKGGGASTSITTAAVDDAIALGADAINLSLGSPTGFTLYEKIHGKDLSAYEYDSVFKKAREAGVIVAAAAGNEGRVEAGKVGYWGVLGLTSYPYASNPDTSLVGSPSTKKDATAVASIENDYQYMETFTFNDGAGNTIEVPFTDNSLTSTIAKKSFAEILNGKTLEYVNCGIGNTEDFANKNLNNKLALIERGTINFSVKVENATKAGAIGVIVYNNASGFVRMKLEDTLIPAIGITQEAGKKMVEAEKTGKVTIIFGKMGETKINEKLMSDFSSWGVTPDLKLKPEITAPGGNIYSSVYDKNDDGTYTFYDTYSGTSMATPHVAGAVAVVREYIEEDAKFSKMTKKEKATVLEALMMSAANTVMNSDNLPYSPRQQGAGLINIASTIKSNAYLMNDATGKAKVELKDRLKDEFNVTFKVVNISNEELTYSLGGSIISDDYEYLKYKDNKTGNYFIKPNSKALTKSQMYFEEVALINNENAVNDAKIVIPANSTKEVTVTVKLSKEDIDEMEVPFENGFFVEGFVELYDATGEQSQLSIPYLGFYGDWAKAPILDDALLYNEKKPFYATKKEGKINFPTNMYVHDVPSDNIMYAGIVDNEDMFGDSELIGFSPVNEKGIYASVALLRNAKEIFVKIKNDKGEVIRELDTSVYEGKTFERSISSILERYTGLMPTILPEWDGKDSTGKIVDDGQYYYVISATIDYNTDSKNLLQEKSFPVKVDTVKPTFKGSYDAQTKLLKVQVKDNTSAYSVTAADPTSFFSYDFTWLGYGVIEGYDIEEKALIDKYRPNEEYEFTVDLKEFKGTTVIVEVNDLAFNSVTMEVDISGSNKFEYDPNLADVKVVHEYNTFSQDTSKYVLDSSKTEVIKNCKVGTTFSAIVADTVKYNDKTLKYNLTTDSKNLITVTSKSEDNVIKLTYTKTTTDIKVPKTYEKVQVSHIYKTYTDDNLTRDITVTELFHNQTANTTFTAIAAPTVYGKTYQLLPNQNLTVNVKKADVGSLGYEVDTITSMDINYKRDDKTNGSNGSGSNSIVKNSEMLHRRMMYTSLLNENYDGDLQAMIAALTKAYDYNETISIIVELEGKTLLENSEVATMGVQNYLATQEAQLKKSNMINMQENIQAKISAIDSSATFKYSYVNIMNGFAAEIKVANLHQIKNIKGVKNLYYDRVYSAPKVEREELNPQMLTSDKMIGIREAWGLGYKGEGRVVAVIDTGAYVEHEIMNISNSTNERLRIEDISKVVSGLNAKNIYKAGTLKASDVYKSKKFPFCFDYVDKDFDVTPNKTAGSHGIHVAGTIAANGISYRMKTVSFDLNGHGESINPVTAVVGDLIAEPTQPVADGFTFKGWYKERQCINQWNFDTDKVEDDMTLYARWVGFEYSSVTVEHIYSSRDLRTTVVKEEGKTIQVIDKQVVGKEFTAAGVLSYNGKNYEMDENQNLTITVYEDASKNIVTITYTREFTSSAGGGGSVAPNPGPSNPGPSNPGQEIDDEKVPGGSVSDCIVENVKEDENGNITADVKINEGVVVATVEIDAKFGDVDGVIFADVTTAEGTIKTMGVYIDGKVRFKVDKNASVKVLKEVTPFAEVPNYTDTVNHWADENIAKAVKLGLFKGTSDITFAPDKNMTREQMWLVLSRLQGVKLSGTGNELMEQAKAWAIENGISDGTNPKGDVTREQFVTLLWRTKGQPKSNFDLTSYYDFSTTSNWAKEAFAWAVERGLVNGTSQTTLSPQGTATRGQMATILARLVY